MSHYLVPESKLYGIDIILTDKEYEQYKHLSKEYLYTKRVNQDYKRQSKLMEKNNTFVIFFNNFGIMLPWCPNESFYAMNEKRKHLYKIIKRKKLLLDERR